MPCVCSRGGRASHLSFQSAGEIETASGQIPIASTTLLSFGSVDEDFFATLGIPIVRGRSFDARDTKEAPPVAVVSRSLAQQIWADGDAIGQQLRLGTDQPWLTVVGIAGDVRNGGFDAPRGVLTVFTARSQAVPVHGYRALVVRSSVRDANLATAVQSLARQMVPGAPVTIEAAGDVIADEHARVRFATYVMSALAAVATALAMLGIYGAFWCAVRQRTREIGVRLALGAAPRDILAMVLTSSGRLVLIAMAFGVPLALAAARGLRTLLYEVSPTDPTTLTGQRRARHRRTGCDLSAGAAREPRRSVRGVAVRVALS